MFGNRGTCTLVLGAWLKGRVSVSRGSCNSFLLRHMLFYLMLYVQLEVPLSSDKRLKDHNKADVAHFLSPDNHMKVLKEVVSNKEVVQYVPFMDYMTYLSQEKFL